jgi:RimJ/RimL family protein N-acetyltransferase
MKLSMNIEQPNKIENISPAKERLLALEKTGKYVFHGSPVIRAILRPQQATGTNEETGLTEKDGEPAIFATLYAETAIFRSLIKDENVTGESSISFGADGENKNYACTKNLLDAARGKHGQVYVFEKDQFFFVEEGVPECRSEKPLVPLEVIEVSVDDLPKDIKIIENEGNKKNLRDFDLEYFKELEGEDGWNALGLENCHNQRYFTVFGDKGEKIGVVGVYDTDDDKNITHTVVDKKYRGMGLAAKFKQLLMDELALPYITMTISLDNVASIRATEKLPGVKRVRDEKYESDYHKAKYVYSK